MVPITVLAAMSQVNLCMLEIAHLALPVSILCAGSIILHTDLGAVVLQRSFTQRWHIAALKSDLNHGALKTQVQHFVGENVAWEKVTTN